MRVERESVFDKHCYCNKQEFRFHTQLLFCEDAPAGCLTSAFGKGWAKSDRRAFAWKQYVGNLAAGHLPGNSMSEI